MGPLQDLIQGPYAPGPKVPDLDPDACMHDNLCVSHRVKYVMIDLYIYIYRPIRMYASMYHVSYMYNVYIHIYIYIHIYLYNRTDARIHTYLYHRPVAKGGWWLGIPSIKSLPYDTAGCWALALGSCWALPLLSCWTLPYRAKRGMLRAKRRCLWLQTACNKR